MGDIKQTLPGKPEDFSVLEPTAFNIDQDKLKENGRKVFAIQAGLRTTQRNTRKLLNSAFSKRAIMPVANAALDALTAARPGFPRRANGRNKEEGRFKITVDGRNPASVDMVKISHYLQGFSTIPSGCFGFLNHQQYHCRKPIGPKFATLFGRINSSTCHVHSLHLYVPTGLSQLHILEYSHPTFLIGNPYTWYINPYGIGLMNIPYYMEPIESLDPIAHMDTCRHRAKQI